jgi:protein-S-isoprenylcysteine O-methyltransferase Ste14
MKATQFEFRYRLWIGFLIYVLGFWAPWLRFGKAAGPVVTTWLELSGELGRVLPLQTASLVITAAAIVLLAAAAILRVSGTAYLGASIVKSAAMHADTVMAAGPFRYLRNPLYLGSFLNELAVSILMPPSGAIFFVVVAFLQILRLVLGEEAYLAAQQGEPYLAYKTRVPRFLPSLTPRVPASHIVPQWINAIIAETFYITLAACFAVLAWRYNAQLLIQAVIICFGFSLVVRAIFVNKAA